MEIEKLPYDLSVCKIKSEKEIDLDKEFYFIGKTDEEISLVCKTDDVPKDVAARSDGRKCFRIKGILDFSLIGILAKISDILAKNEIGIFAVSTFNTDYILVKAADFEKASECLSMNGYNITEGF